MKRFALWVFLCLFGSVSSALAHADLLQATPSAGEILPTSPPEIRLFFSEPLGEASTFTLLDEGFQTVTDIRVRQDVPGQLVATLPILPPNTYTVQWTAVSVDGHTISGSYTFGVASPTSILENWIILSLFLSLLGLGIWWQLRQRRAIIS